MKMNKKKDFPENNEICISQERNKESVSLLDSKKNIYKVIWLGLIFLLIYTSTNAFQNMISQIYHQMGYSFLGNLTLIVNCLSLSLSAIIAPFATKFFSFKITMFICSFSFIVSQIVGVFTAYCSDEGNQTWVCHRGILFFLNLFAALLSGFFSLILWICQCGYTTNISNHRNKSLFFGIFCCIFQISLISGSALTVFVMNIFKDQFTFFNVILVITMISAANFLCIPHVEKLNFVEEGNFSSKIIELFQLFKKRDKFHISAIAMFCGLEIGFWTGNLYRFVEVTLDKNLSKEQINVYTAWVFVALGLLETVGGLIASAFGDRFAKINLVIFANLSIFVSFLVALMLIFFRNYYLCFFVAIFLGIGDCILQIMLNALTSCQENNNILHFSHYILIQNFAMGMSIIFGLCLSNFADVILMMILQLILFSITIHFK